MACVPLHPSVRAQPVAWRERLGRSSPALRPSVGCSQLCSSTVPLRCWTDVCSPFSPNAFCLVTWKKCQLLYVLPLPAYGKEPLSAWQWPHVTVGLETSELPWFLYFCTVTFSSGSGLTLCVELTQFQPGRLQKYSLEYSVPLECFLHWWLGGPGSSHAGHSHPGI